MEKPGFNLLPLALIIPSIFIMLVIGAYPILQSIYLSMTNLSIVNPEPQFVGLDNYVNFLNDPNFWNAVRVTLFYTASTVSAEFAIGLLLTMLLFGEVTGRRFFETMIIIPLAIPPITMGVLSSPNAFLDDLNTLFYYGLCIAPLCSGNTGFFVQVTDPQIYYTMIILADAFIWSPLIALVMLAILRSVPKEIFEAAEVNGASAWQKFRHIIIPSLLASPVLGAILALRAVDSFRAFEIPYAWSFWLGQERPGSPVDTFSVLMFKMLTYSVYQFPLAQIAAIALILLVISIASAWTILRLLSRNWVTK